MPAPSGRTHAIRATRVIGTTVFNTGGERLGRIEDVVLDKLSNNIVFAVIGFGGFLGMNEKFRPLPWSSLDYDAGLGGYVVGYSLERLEAIPTGDIDALNATDGEVRGDRVYHYYDTPPYWQ